jgi:hypothetical protein
MPILRRCDLRRIDLVAANKSSKQLARFGRNANRQQKMPHHRHSIATQYETLNIDQI